MQSARRKPAGGALEARFFFAPGRRFEQDRRELRGPHVFRPARERAIQRPRLFAARGGSASRDRLTGRGSWLGKPTAAITEKRAEPMGFGGRHQPDTGFNPAGYQRVTSNIRAEREGNVH